MRLVDALADEERSDQIVDTEVVLGDEITQRRRPPEAARSGRGRRQRLERHVVEPNDSPTVPRRGPNRRGRAGSVLGVSVQAWFSNDDVTVAPGSRLTLTVTVHNLGESTESYTIVPAGLAASWTSVSRGNLTLFGGSQEIIDVEIAPPALPTTSAGPTAIVIRIIPLGDADEAVVAECTVEIDSFDDCRLVALQPIQRARHRATYEFMVENHGNTVASCRLHLIDPTDRIDGDFDPPAVGVAPGAASLVRLKVRAQRGGFRPSTRTLDFDIEAARQGVAPITSSLAFVQSPTIPTETIGRVAVAVAVGIGLILAWFGLIKPTIEDAVADEAATQGVTTATTPGAAAPTTTVAPDQSPTGVGASGEPTFFRLDVAAPLTQTADQSTTMPEVFDMTDVRIENAFGDKGVATMLINGDPVYVWSLANVRGSTFEPSITPIRLQTGDIVAFSVKCDEIGDPTRATCTTSLNVGGVAISDGS